MASAKKKTAKTYPDPLKDAGIPIINLYDIGFFDEVTNSLNVISVRGESAYRNWQEFRERSKKELGLDEGQSVSLYRNKDGEFHYKLTPMS